MVVRRMYPPGSTAPAGLASIIGADPGESTGMAWIMFSLRQLREEPWRDVVSSAMSSGRFRTGTVTGLNDQDRTDGIMEWAFECEMEVKRRLPRLPATASGISHWVIEDFILRERTKDRSLLSPVRLTENIERDLHTSGYPGRIVKYSASDAKGICSNERLKTWGFYRRGARHERDALRQLLMMVRTLKGGLA